MTRNLDDDETELITLVSVIDPVSNDLTEYTRVVSLAEVKQLDGYQQFSKTSTKCLGVDGVESYRLGNPAPRSTTAAGAVSFAMGTAMRLPTRSPRTRSRTTSPCFGPSSTPPRSTSSAVVRSGRHWYAVFNDEETHACPRCTAGFVRRFRDRLRFGRHLDRRCRLV